MAGIMVPRVPTVDVVSGGTMDGLNFSKGKPKPGLISKVEPAS